MKTSMSIIASAASVTWKRAATTLLLEQGSMVDGGTSLLDTSGSRLSA